MAAKKLSAVAIAKAKTPGLLNDGAGLYLRIKQGGTKSWIYRFKLNGRSRDKGLGGYPDVSLAEAREAADEARKLAKAGVDPIEPRAVVSAPVPVGKAPASGLKGKRDGINFQDAAEELIAMREPGWRNAKTPYVWRSRLREHAFPVIGQMDVSDITPADVLRCLSPIWYTKTETATKLRGYIEAVLDWAGAKGYREKTQNPAAWEGNLKHSGLMARKDFAIVESHPAMPYADLPDFMVELRKRDALAARALEFVILTACRSGDMRNAPWREFDLSGKVWTIPATRQLKSRRQHRVPLSGPAVALLDRLPRLSAYVFPGQRDGQPFSDMAMNMLLRRMGVTEYHTHGFRSTFKDWTIEQTDFPHAISEMALAHDIGSGTEKAYRRSDFFDKRRILMEQWADYCASASPAIAAPTVEPVERMVFSPAVRQEAGRGFLRELVSSARRRR